MDSMDLVLLKMACFIRMMMLFQALTLEGALAALLAVPENEMFFLNRTTELQCSTNSVEPIGWSFTSAGSHFVYIILFIHDNFTTYGDEKYKIDRSIRGQYNLVIESADFSYAGKYKCTEGSFGPEVEAELVVIDPQPLCQANASNTDNSVVENDYLWMQCSIRFSGNINLSMSWIRSSTGNIIPSSSNLRNQSMIVIQVNSSDNDETFTFNATFRQENNSRQTVITWNYTAKVLYTPRNLVVSPVKTVYVVGDRLECSADGNPAPSYEWTDTETNRTITGSFLTIEEYLKSDQNHSFMCTAYNTVAGIRKNISETVTFIVTGSTTASKGLSSAMIVLMIVVMFICLIIIIVVLFSCRTYVKAWTTKQCALIADSEPDVVRSDPMTQDNHYYEIEDLLNEGAITLTVTSTDDSVAQQAESAFSVYELIGGEDNETMTDGLSPSQQVHIPAYSKVNKDDRRQDRRNRETQMAPSQTPVYSEVARTNPTVLTIHHGSNMSDLVSTTRAANTAKTNYFGADGTEYTQVNSFGDRPVAPTPNSSMFRPVDNYAMIDHTRRAPPPLPKL